MTDHSPQALDSLHDGRMPAWEQATARVRRMHRLQVALLLLVGSAIIVIVAIGGMAYVNASEEQNETEARGAEILKLRGDFAAALFDVQTVALEGAEPPSPTEILGFLSQATSAYTVASSYEPTNPDELRARDQLLALYDSFLEFGGGSNGITAFQSLAGTSEGTNLALPPP